MSEPFAGGFIVLTVQPDGTWKDDWDGEIHVDQVEAHKATHEAEAELGEANVQLCRVLPFEDTRTVNADTVRAYLDPAIRNWQKTLAVTTPNSSTAEVCRQHIETLQHARMVLLGSNLESA